MSHIKHKMSRRKSGIANRAWNLLLLSLLWARKGGVFKRRFPMDLHFLPKFIKSIGHDTRRGQIYYGERELSFEKTPIVHVKMHRPASMRFNIPCFNPPPIDFDYEFDGDEVYSYGGGRECVNVRSGEEEDGYVCENEEEDGIDLRAEEFIAKFYEQMKLQRQISLLQYN